MSKQELTDEERLQARRLRRAARQKKQQERRKRAQLATGRAFKGDPGHRCKAKTRTTGEPCPMHRAILEHPETGKLYRASTCFAHLPTKVRKMFQLAEFGGKVPGTGGARLSTKRTVPEVMKEMVEQEITAWLKPYFDSLHATKPIVVGNGRHARIEHVPDMRARTQAAEAVLDRLYGKAKQQTELTGLDGGPIEVEVPTGKDRQLAVAQILADAGALPDQQEKVKKTAVAARAASRN